MTRVLGIDVGGSKIAAAIVDVVTGETEAEEVVPNRGDRDGGLILADCVHLAERIAELEPVGAIGIGICELVDLDDEVRSGVSVAWEGVDVAAAFAHIAPARVESDVRAAALAEARFGAGRWRRNFLFVNIGTGISSALVLDGVPYQGARGNAILLGEGPPNVEHVASGRAIAARFGVASAQDVVAAAHAGDAAARSVLIDAGAAVGEAVAFAVNLLDPEAVVCGGGIALNAPWFVDALEESMRRHISAAATRDVPLLAAELGGRAPVVGAGLAAAVLLGAEVA